MANSSSTVAIDHGTLRLRLDIDLSTLAIALLFVTVAALEIAALAIGGSAQDAIEALSITT